MQSESSYRELKILMALPQGQFLPEGGEEVLRRLVGATILAIGSPVDGDVDGGGLVIDYRSTDGERRRVVFGFSSSGLWVDWEGLV